MKLKYVILMIIVYIIRIFVNGNNVKIYHILIVRIYRSINNIVIKILFNNVNLQNYVKIFKIQLQYKYI